MALRKILANFSDFLCSSFYRIFYKKPNVMTTDETLNFILENKCSISRYGDGELRIMRGESISFQEGDKVLSKKLKEIKTNNNCLICIPNVFTEQELSKNRLVDNEYKFWSKFELKRGGLWNYYFRNNQLLGDAFISRFYFRYRDKSTVKDTIDKLKKLWDSRNIVFVEGKQSRLGVGNDLFSNAKSIKRILCPTTHAFRSYEKIVESINKFCTKEDLIILALGPTASVLAYELSNKYQCLDLGHIDVEYEWYKNGVTNKTAIANKYVNEAPNGNIVGDLEDQNYANEIVDTID